MVLEIRGKPTGLTGKQFAVTKSWGAWYYRYESEKSSVTEQMDIEILCRALFTLEKGCYWLVWGESGDLFPSLGAVKKLSSTWKNITKLLVENSDMSNFFSDELGFSLGNGRRISF